MGHATATWPDRAHGGLSASAEDRGGPPVPPSWV